MFRNNLLFSILDLYNNKNDEKSDEEDTNSMHTTISPPKDNETDNEKTSKKDLKSATKVIADNDDEVDVHKRESNTELSQEKVDQCLARATDVTTSSPTFLSPR